MCNAMETSHGQGSPEIQGAWVATGPPTIMTNSLDLHDYHKCHTSTLGVRRYPRTPSADAPTHGGDGNAINVSAAVPCVAGI